MKLITYFKMGLICLTMLVLSCEKDDIKVSNSEYDSGGIGTSQTTGAIEFNFIIPRHYASGKVSVELPDLGIYDEVQGTGDLQIKFLNISSGTYNYLFELWALENNFGGGSVEDGHPLNKYFTLNENLEVRNGKTLKIKVDLD